MDLSSSSHEWVGITITMIDYRMDCECAACSMGRMWKFPVFFSLVECKLNQQRRIMDQLLRVLKIDLLAFDQLVHVHRHVQHHRNPVNRINHHGMVQILNNNNQQRKVHLRLVQEIFIEEIFTWKRIFISFRINDECSWTWFLCDK